MDKTLKYLFLDLELPNGDEELPKLLEQQGVNYEVFIHPMLLTEYLTNHKQKLDQIALILNIISKDTTYIDNPKKWNEYQTQTHRTYNNGLNAGFVWYTKLVLEDYKKTNKIWLPPPKTIFYSTVDVNASKLFSNQFEQIRKGWANNANCEISEAQVKFIRSFNIAEKIEEFNF